MCGINGTIHHGSCDDIVDNICACKQNVMGSTCNVCKGGYWNLNASNPDGCQKCTCHPFGTQKGIFCSPYTGECACRQLTMGKNCELCVPETYGLEDANAANGCLPCNCDAGGSINNICDVKTGQCPCRPNMIGRNCSMLAQNTFIPKLQKICEAETAQCEPWMRGGVCDLNCKCAY